MTDPVRVNAMPVPDLGRLGKPQQIPIGLSVMLREIDQSPIPAALYYTGDQLLAAIREIVREELTSEREALAAGAAAIFLRG